MMKVGRDIVQMGEKVRKFLYSDVKYDADGWAEAKKFMPADYDLVFMKTEKKTYNGWASGKIWDGLKIPDEPVLYWKCHT